MASEPEDAPRFYKDGRPMPKGFKPWVKGQSGNPGGTPKGFVGPALAYKVVSQLTYKEVERLAKGKFPVGWKHSRAVIYCRAASEFLSAGTRGSPQELNLRMEGPVAQKIDLAFEAGSPFAILASLAPPAAAQLEAEVIDTPALAAAEEE